MDVESKLEQIRMRIVMEGDSRRKDNDNLSEIILDTKKQIISYLKSILIVLQIICLCFVFYLIKILFI